MFAALLSESLYTGYIIICVNMIRGKSSVLKLVINKCDLTCYIVSAVLSGGSFYAFALPSLCISSALVTQMQPHKRSHINASALIRFIKVTQPH